MIKVTHQFFTISYYLHREAGPGGSILRIYDIGTKDSELRDIPETLPPDGIFVTCSVTEARELAAAFGWEENTVKKCFDPTGTVQYIACDGYDFVSLIHMETAGEKTVKRIISMFFSKQYFVLVLPEQKGGGLDELTEDLCRFIEDSETKANGVEQLYYLTLSWLAAAYSNMLEKLEDDMETLSEAVAIDSRKRQINEISRLRKLSYKNKKILRAISYVSEEIREDENNLIGKEQVKHFRVVSTRFKKLYDFAESLYELSGEILNIYDSNMALKMNESIDKLSAIMMFLAAITVITGIFNMDFRFLPEIDSIVGYPLAMGVIALVCFILYRSLRKQNWK